MSAEITHPLSEAQSIYYGLQLMAVNKTALGSDKLFVIRAICVPIGEWTDAMWMEAARIIALHRRLFVSASRPDPINFALVARMANKAPVNQALLDARSATPRPSEEQLAEVQELAAELKAERKAIAPRYDVELTPDLGFAVLHIKRIYDATALPGYCEVEGQVQCWLCSELRDFIIDNGLEPAPNVLPAIVSEIERLEKAAPWALVLEKASTCSDPANYPPQLVSVLRAMNVKGLSWT